MGRLGDRVGAQGFGDARRLTLQHRARRLGRDVARREAGAARRQNEVGARGELLDRDGDRVGLVGNDAPDDRIPVGAQQLLEQVAARVLRLTARHAIGDGQHRRVHDLVFSSNSTLNVICLSIAFAMS